MKIIHLAQAHKLPFGIEASQEFMDECLKSQLAIANFITQYKNVPVVLESLMKNYDGDPGPMSVPARMIFPAGLPTEPGQLEPLQKEFLYSEGAVFSLCYLSVIDNVYRSIHPEISAIVDKQIAKGDVQKIFGAREEEAMACIDEIVTAKNPQSIILVYGAAHDFSSYCAQRGYEYERIDTVNEASIRKNPANIIKSPANSLDINRFFSQLAVQQSSLTCQAKKSASNLDEGIYPIADTNLAFRFEPYITGRLGEARVCMRLIVAGDDDIGMIIQKKDKNLMLYHLNDAKKLISILKTWGVRATKMADAIEWHLKPDFDQVAAGFKTLRSLAPETDTETDYRFLASRC